MSCRSLTFAILLLSAAACSDDDSAGNGAPCDRAATVRDDAVTDFCDGKQATCCHCTCWEDYDGNFDAVALYTSAACECVTPSPSPGECAGESLDAAEHCLDDEDSCAQVAADVAEAQCQDSLL